MPTVVGVSEGGITGCLAAAARPDRIERLVLINAVAAGFDPRGRGEMTDAEYEEWLAMIRETAANWGEGRTVLAGFRGSRMPMIAGADCSAPAQPARWLAGTWLRSSTA